MVASVELKSNRVGKLIIIQSNETAYSAIQSPDTIMCTLNIHCRDLQNRPFSCATLCINNSLQLSNQPSYDKFYSIVKENTLFCLLALSTLIKIQHSSSQQFYYHNEKVHLTMQSVQGLLSFSIQ